MYTRDVQGSSQFGSVSDFMKYNGFGFLIYISGGFQVNRLCFRNITIVTREHP